jgi:uncharacterized protein GlcG (DUF336 family)
MLLRTGVCIVATAMLVAAPARAQTPATQQPAVSAPAAPPPLQYGAPIGLEPARRATAAALAEADRIGAAPLAVAIVDPAGYLVHFARMDNTQYGSIAIAIDKARTAALYRRSTKVFEDALAGGEINLRILALPAVAPIEGGLPIVAGGRVIGAIGVGGGTAQQDGQAAAAGAAAVK